MEIYDDSFPYGELVMALRKEISILQVRIHKS